MPGKNSNVRRGAQGAPLFFDRAEGARYWDLEGKDYIDYVAGMGPAIWGHSNKEYLDTVKSQLEKVFSLGSTVAQQVLEVELAEKIVQHVPCAEWVRLGISGSEAVQLALRVARAYSSRPYVLRFENHYHGWIDNVHGGRAPASIETFPHPLQSETDTGGLAPGVRDQSLMIRWNDTDALEAVLDRYADQIAVVLMEAVMLNYGCCPPRPGYLEAARKLCDKYDVLLCFDEVFTGFRLGLGGAQAEFGVTPDLAVFAKAMAGGLPLSAVAGNAEILEVLRSDEVLVGGTFNSFPLAVAAAVTNIEMLARNDGAFYRRIDDRQRQLIDGIREVGRQHGHAVFLQGPRGVFHLNFLDKETAYTPADLACADWAKLVRFNELLLRERILIGGGSRFVITDGLTQEDIDETLRRIDKAMRDL
jgi:glutamate-1-semialdehyde 2,1-aminomutase